MSVKMMFRDEDSDEGADDHKVKWRAERESKRNCTCGDCEEGLCSGKLYSLN